MFKKLCGLCLAVLMPGMVFAEVQPPFPDVPVDHQYVEAIGYLYDNDIVSGYPDGTFKPDAQINRAEFLKILVGSGNEGLAYADELESPQSDCFTDVGSEWFAAYVCAGKAFGWVDGYPDGSYKPEQTVNKVEAIKMVLNAKELADLPDPSTITVKPYDDVPLGEWYTPYVMRVKELGILEETGGNLNPGANMSRAGISEMMYRSEFVVTPEPGFVIDLEMAMVTRVVDGDTLEVDLDGVTEKVRLLGIDTPEFSSSDCYAQEATDYIEGLVLGKEVALKADALNVDRDRYDRLLRYVELDGLDINKKMIRDGYALYYDTYDVLRGAEYAEAQLAAQTEVLGLWGDCQGAEEPGL